MWFEMEYVISSTSQLAGYYMMATLAFNELRYKWKRVFWEVGEGLLTLQCIDV